MLTVYGIKNCDTVKKALLWLSAHDIKAHLHDYRSEGIDSVWLEAMLAQFGWEALINKRSTTWRNLDENVKAELNANNVLDILLAHPTLIKRPIISNQQITLIGFSETTYQQHIEQLK